MNALAISPRRSLHSLFLSLLAAMVTLVLGGTPSYAQLGGNPKAGPPAQTDTTQNQCAKDTCDDYDKRYPYMKAARKADTHNKKYGDTPQEESDEGTPEPFMSHVPMYYPGLYQPMFMSKTAPAQSRDNEITQNKLPTNGLWLSDTMYQMIDRENNQRFAEQAFDPEKMMWMAHATASMQTTAAGNGMARVAEQTMSTALDRIVNADTNFSLINVANEASGADFAVHAPYRTIPNAVGMVQAMYKAVFVPMAILFLLPGAVASQVKGQIGRGFAFLGYAEAQNPFEGMMRAMVAIFLIPATQVIVSWSIDTGNSMAYSVNDWVDVPMIMDWIRQLAYNTHEQNDQNALPSSVPSGGGAAGAGAGGAGAGAGGGGNPLSAGLAAAGGAIGGTFGSWLTALANFIGGASVGGGMGLGANQPETQAVMEQTGSLGQILQAGLNFIVFMSALFLVILSAFQLVLMCYFLLLGPLAAAFYAWPQAGNTLFRNVFGSWVVGVIQVALWRFYWMVVLAVMTQRLNYTGGLTSDLQWEVMMLVCFLGILLWAPGSPFDFSPAAALAKAESLAQQAKEQGKGGGGGGKGGGGGGHSKGGDSSHDKTHSQNSETQTPGEAKPADGQAKPKDPAAVPANSAPAPALNAAPPANNGDPKSQPNGSGPNAPANASPVAALPPGSSESKADAPGGSNQGPAPAAKNEGSPPVPLGPSTQQVQVSVANQPPGAAKPAGTGGDGDGDGAAQPAGAKTGGEGGSKTVVVAPPPAAAPSGGGGDAANAAKTVSGHNDVSGAGSPVKKDEK